MNHVDVAALGVNLLVSAVIVAVVLLGTFAYALRSGVHAIMDSMWSLGFVIIAAVTFALSSGKGNDTVRTVVLVLTALWGLRLSGYIFLRNRGTGEDPRYAALLRHSRGNPTLFVLRRVYWAQGKVMWWISLPIQVVMYERAAPGVLTWIGVSVWAIGLGFESVGDLQLARFKREPANHGRILDRGLWSLTRHPNYFGDATLWWGLWLVSCNQWIGLLTVTSPLLMNYMLVKRTGKALLEKGMRRSRGAAYEEYVARTSGFLPRRQRASAPQTPR